VTLLDPTTTSTATRDRILSAAYVLLSSEGSEQVTFEAVAAASGEPVEDIRARFPDEHVLMTAAVEHSAHQWTAGILEAIARTGARTPDERLLALFPVYDEWFGQPDFDSVGLMKILAEAGRAQRRGDRTLVHVERVRTVLATLAAEAGLRDADDFALSVHVLLKAAILAAIEGDSDALHRAERMARALVEEHRPAGERPQEPVVLAPGADDREWLVVSERAKGSRGENALALIRQEQSGYCCFPNVVGYGRLGPFETLDEAYSEVLTLVVPSAG
jgi:AcrR family transcriptional regulator